jgi:hypothetical protein
MTNYPQKQPKQAGNSVFPKLATFVFFNAIMLYLIAFCASFEASGEVFFLSIGLVAFNFISIALFKTK